MDNNITTNIGIPNAEEKVFFCRKCGNQLTDQMTVCEQCGTSVLNEQIEQEELPFDNDEYEESKKRLKKKKRKKVLTIVAVILSVIILAVAGFFISKLIVVPQDINTINGCPEFYDIEFGMTLSQASKNIKLEHKTIEGIEGNSLFEVDDFMKEDKILIDDEEVFYLYGKKTDSVYIGFDIDRVDSVIFNFSSDKYSLDNIVSLYKRIYGEPTSSGSIYATWSGPKTTIDVFEYISEDDEEESIVVRYVITPNSQYTALTFDGAELDPCDFLGKNNPFNKTPDYFVKGLKEDDDYKKEEFSAEGFGGFKKYTLYPRFMYAGIDKGYTAISFDMGYDAKNIETASYLFLLSDSNAVDRLKYIHSALTEKYGAAKSSTYTSTYYDKMGVKDVGFDEMIKRIEKGTEGIYHVQWQSEGRNITLGLTISVDKEYYEGSVAYTD